MVCCIGCLAGMGCSSVSTQAVSRPSGVEKLLAPSNDRSWQPDQSVLATAEFRGNRVIVRNVRNARYAAAETYVLDYEDREYALDKLQSVDLVVIPFANSPSLAHTMLSFGFSDGQYVAVSVEVRKELGESYSPLLGLMRQFEIMYVIGDERDLIGQRANQRGDDVYLYPIRATPQQVRQVFTDVMLRANQLASTPEFYDTLSNNCTTNLVAHVNRLYPGRIPWEPRMLLTGSAPEIAYELGLLQGEGSFEALRRAAWISGKSRQASLADYSNLIRR